MNPAKDVWDLLVQWVPANLHPGYWQTVAKVRKIPLNDDIVSLLSGMGILALLLRQVPELVAEQKSDWERRGIKIQHEMKESQALATDQFQKGAKEWNAAVEKLEAFEMGLHTTVTRMEKVQAEMSEKMIPLESMTAKVDGLLGLFNQSISRAEKARESIRLILMRWTYINAGITAVLLIWIILSITFR